MYDYNCPDCNETKLQTDKNARKINEVIDQVNALIQVNNETVDFIEEKVSEVAEVKVNEQLGDLITEIDNIAEINVKNYGAKGDGITDDTNAIISAINDFTLKGGNKLIFPNGAYKITESLIIDLKENRNMCIEMNGYIIPNEGIGRAISIINGVNVNATIKVKGGGLYKYHKGFSTDVTDLDCALYIRAISGLVLNMFTDDFRGRGIEVEKKRTSDNVKTDMFNFGKLIFRNVGQAMFVQADSGIGNFGDIWAIETDGSYFNGVDLSINSYENAKVGEPVVFEGCVSLHLGRILLGENNDLIKFENCHNTTVQHLYLFGFNQVNLGCTIVNCRQMDINIKSNGCNTAVLINGLIDTNINIISKNDKTICFVATSAYSVENVNFNIIGRDTVYTGFETSKGEWLFDSVTLSGKFNNIVVDSKDVCIDVVNSHIHNFTIPAENNIRVINNRFGSFNNEPKLKQFCE